MLRHNTVRRPCHDNKPNPLTPAIALGKILLGLGNCKPECSHDSDSFTDDGGAVFAINHPDTFSAFVAMRYIQEQTDRWPHALIAVSGAKFWTPGEIVKVPNAIGTAGMRAIWLRCKSERSRHQSVTKMTSLARSGDYILVAPEGRITPHREKIPHSSDTFYPGAIEVASKAKVPVIPVGTYHDEVTVRVHIGHPVDPSSLPEDKHAAIRELMADHVIPIARDLAKK